MKNRDIWLITLAVVVIVASAYILRTYRKEHFQNKLDDSTFAEAYKLNGIEKCSALQYPSMTASNIIDTGRLREWKPTGSHPNIRNVKADTQHGYCYYYTDDDKQILQGTDEANSAILAPVYDPMLVGACSTDPATGSLWSRFPALIKGAFEDKEADANHKLPYKKCVLKVAKDTPAETQKLWQYVEDQDLICKGALEAVQKEYNTYVNRLSQLHNENEAYRRDYGTRDELADKLRTCTTQSNDLADNLIPNMQRATESLQRRIITDRSQLDQALQQIRTDQTQLDKQWETIASDLVTKTRTKQVLEDSIAQLTSETAALDAQRNACRQTHATLVEEAKKRSDIVEKLKERYNYLEGQYNQCKEQLDQYNADIKRMTKERITLKERAKDLSIQLEGCNKEKQTATIEEEAWRKKADQLRIEYEACSKERALEQALYDGYVAQASALTAEIEDIKKRCRTVENEFYKANLETSRSQAATAIETTKTYCANVSAMKAKKAALMDELCELNARVKAMASVPPPCNDGNRMKMCCPYKVIPGTTVGIFHKSTNFEGPILRIRTSEATVERVRDNFTDGSYVGLEGIPEVVYKLAATKRDKGGDDWVKLAQVHPDLGSLHTAASQRRNWVTVTNPPPEPFAPPRSDPDPPIGLGDRFC
jgi:uncharacterized protein YdcH (DUF465 family)